MPAGRRKTTKWVTSDPESPPALSAQSNPSAMTSISEFEHFVGQILTEIQAGQAELRIHIRCSVGKSITFATREVWIAGSPNRTTPLENPLERVIVHHTAGPQCNDSETCASIVRGIQDFYMDGNPRLPDIAYNTPGILKYTKGLAGPNKHAVIERGICWHRFYWRQLHDAASRWHMVDAL